ncbi:MAG TPA: hypothetical protein VM711_04055, partial [Sphingomicrobium sp.]|nr:hypothetical protein [Sphingomicrobium sp.]
MRALALGVIAFLLLAPPPARSENGTGCGKFAWSVARELASFAAPDKPRIASGDTLPTVPTGP